MQDLIPLSACPQEKCPLLTGDARLRIASERQRVEVHGTLSLVGQMVEAHVIVARQADAAYRHMRQAGRRLPWDEVEEQLRAFKK